MHRNFATSVQICEKFEQKFGPFIFGESLLIMARPRKHGFLPGNVRAGVFVQWNVNSHGVQRLQPC